MALFPDSAPFATPKPEQLMERVIHIASDLGDIVLDFFAGLGDDSGSCTQDAPAVDCY